MSVILRSKPIDGNIYARAGEVSCCENGHPLARMARDVMFGTQQSNEDFEPIMPNIMGAPCCPECGAPVNTDGGMFFLEGK